MKTLTAGNMRSRCAAVHEVLGRPAVKTPVNSHSKVILDMLRNVQWSLSVVDNGDLANMVFWSVWSFKKTLNRDNISKHL